MPHAIITKFLGPTDRKRSRIKATCWRDSATIHYDHTRCSSHGAHRAAAEALMDKINKDPDSLGSRWKLLDENGSLPDGSGYAFILV